MKTFEDILIKVNNLNQAIEPMIDKPTKAASARMRKQLNEFRKQIPAIRKALIELDSVGYKK